MKKIWNTYNETYSDSEGKTILTFEEAEKVQRNIEILRLKTQPPKQP
jgi:hypothetical protein